jgi:AcrR family transcriptional regulator
MAEAAAGQRDAQKAATRTRLQARALELFHERGFDATTIADIAAAAGVTERTFYRYFPSKEACLYQDYEHRLDWFRNALLYRPADEPLIETIVAAVESFPDDEEIVRQVAELRGSSLDPAVNREHLGRVQAAFATELEVLFRTRLGDAADAELTALVAANAVAGALLATLEVWTRHGGGEPADMRPLTRQALATLTELTSLLT